MRKLLFAIVMVAGLAVPGFSATINVPGDQPTIQGGINASVDGDTVLIAEGTYTGAGNYNIDFSGKSITVKSVNGPETCIIDCQQLGRGFLVYSGETVTLDGLTVENGDAGEKSSGGGVHVKGSEIIVVDCTFTSNSADNSGGAVHSPYSSSSFTNCIFISNSAIYGGAINYLDSSSSLTNCTFTLNEVTGKGGAIGCNSSLAEDPIILRNCILWGNTSLEGLVIYEGGSLTYNNLFRHSRWSCRRRQY